MQHILIILLQLHCETIDTRKHALAVLESIWAVDTQMDGQTDRQTDRHRGTRAILYIYRYARGVCKNKEIIIAQILFQSNID